MGAFMVESSEYCTRIRSVQSYGDMNKEVSNIVCVSSSLLIIR